jgi:hypothetical protein
VLVGGRAATAAGRDPADIRRVIIGAVRRLGEEIAPRVREALA